MILVAPYMICDKEDRTIAIMLGNNIIMQATLPPDVQVEIGDVVKLHMEVIPRAKS